MKNIISKAFLLASLSLMALSCTKTFDEVNTDPDRPNNAPLTNILCYSLRYASTNLFDPWNDMNEPSTYGGHLAKIQYIDEAKYQYRSGVVENKWYYINLTMNNFRNIQARAAENGLTNMLSVAQTFEAVLIQISTDTWRDVPYSEAYSLDEGILNPKYDKQEDIYPALLTLLKTAADGFAAGNGDDLGVGDALYNGNVEGWQKFCNSMRLRLAMRISAVDAALAKSTVEEILGNPTKYPVIKDNADNAFLWWPGGSWKEPWYNDSRTRDDHGVSDVLVDILKGLDDPRLAVYAHPASDGEYRGFQIGAPAVAADLSTISRIGARFRDDETGFTPYFRAAETWFHISEAAMLGWSVGSSAAEAYTAGVTASLEENGIAEDEIAAYLAAGASFGNTKEQIYMQEWISLFKQGMEVWSLYRRTGIPTTHYVAPARAGAYKSHNTPPLRYPYPTNEYSLNGNNLGEVVDGQVDDFWGTPMYWDKRGAK